MYKQRSTLLKTLETTKLFYDIYPYKIDLRLQLAPIFREKKFGYTREVLDYIQLDYELGRPLIWRKGYRTTEPLEINSFLDAKLFFNICQSLNYEDYKLRVEQSHLALYTKEYSIVDKIKNLMHDKVVSIHEPNKQVDLKPNTIYTEKPIEYEYKVTLGNKVNPGAGKWIENNPSLIKAGQICIENIKNDGYTQGFYIFAKNEKVLNLLSIALGGNIKRVDKYINITQS